MSRLILSSPAAVVGLAWAGLATALCGLALGLLLLPQRLLLRTLNQGVVTLHVGADRQLRLWHQPVSRSELPPFFGRQPNASRAAAYGWCRIPRCPGGAAGAAPAARRGPLPLELQLPATPAGSPTRTTDKP